MRKALRLFGVCGVVLLAACVSSHRHGPTALPPATDSRGAVPESNDLKHADKIGDTKSRDKRLKPVTLRSDYRHDRFVTKPREIVREFEAFTTSFDSKADDGVAFGIPDFVAYELKRYVGKLPAGPDRPRPWMSDDELVAQGLAPKDDSYAYSHEFLARNQNWFVRGHLCMKQHAWRLGANADWNTHTMLNAVPQRSLFNSGIWQELEDLTAVWADAYEAIWIVTGPIVEGKRAKSFLGEERKGEFLVAIPDALFKIVVKDTAIPGRPDVLAFRFPQDHPKFHAKAPRDLSFFLTSIDVIERETGLDFLTELPDAIEAEVEASKAQLLWRVPKETVARN